jgi:sugar lactone lactonase YvrE
VAGGPTGFAFVNANGIAATPDGETLILVQSNTGKLFTVDPDTGATRLIDAPLVPNGDGILLVGPLLFVVQNEDNGLRLYAINARFSSPQTPETTYDVVKVG